MTRRIIIVTAIIIAMTAVSVYFYFDPEDSIFFPPCPIHKLTGTDCPGCGSQRAIHALLHGDIASAWRFNALLLISIPFIAVLAVAEFTRKSHPRFYTSITSKKVFAAVFFIIIAWWIIRNIL